MRASSPTAVLCAAFVAVVAACSGGGAVKGGPFKGDPSNFTYNLDGKTVTLKNGTFEEKTGDKPDDVIATDLTSATLDADFDGDGVTDRAVVLTRDDGPIKVHYLGVVPGGGGSSTTLALGKNVLVQKLDLDPRGNGDIIVTMLTRDEGVPVDSPPTIEAHKRFGVKEGKLVAR